MAAASTPPSSARSVHSSSLSSSPKGLELSSASGREHTTRTVAPRSSKGRSSTEKRSPSSARRSSQRLRSQKIALASQRGFFLKTSKGFRPGGWHGLVEIRSKGLANIIFSRLTNYFIIYSGLFSA